MAFVEQSFNGAILREKQNNKMRYEFPQQSQQSLSDMFGFIEVGAFCCYGYCCPLRTPCVFVSVTGKRNEV